MPQPLVGKAGKEEGQPLRRHRHVAEGPKVQGQLRRPRQTSTAWASPSRPASATSPRRSARGITRAAAKDPEALAQLRGALASVTKAKVPGSSTTKKVALPGQNLEGAQTVGISATVKALEDIILHGRKEVEGNTPGCRTVRRRAKNPKVASRSSW